MTRQGDAKAGGWSGLIFAMQFLTIFPLARPHRFNARAALPFFPLCGLLIGAILMSADVMAAKLWPRSVVAVLDVLLLVVVSGALHLDGLADTADGLYGRRNPEHALTIMKDSRTGAMGVVAVICCLAVKWAGLAHLSAHHGFWLLLVPAYARASILIGTKALPYGRSKEGTAHAFFQSPLTIPDFWGLGLLLPLSLIIGWQAIGLNLGFALMAILILSWYHRRMGCITGDMLGAMIEVIEAGLFLVAALHWGP